MKYSEKLELTWVNKDKDISDLMKIEPRILVEVKTKKDVKNEEVIEKAKVGRWCNHASTCDQDKKKWHCLLVADDVVEEGNSLKHTLGLLVESIGE